MSLNIKLLIFFFIARTGDLSYIFKLLQNIFNLIIITGLPAAEVQKFYKITPFSTSSEISELWMAGKPFIMMGLIKVWGVLKRSDKFPSLRMKILQYT